MADSPALTEDIVAAIASLAADAVITQVEPLTGGVSAEVSRVTFVSGAAKDAGIAGKLGLSKRLVAVRGTRSLKKSDLPFNGAMPRMEVNAQTYDVRADGVLLRCEPAKVLPMAQRYFLF